MGQLKRGRWSESEMTFMRANKHLPTAELAAKLNRSPDAVHKWMKEHVPTHEVVPVTAEETEVAQTRLELHQSATWKKLRQQFDEDELEKLEEQYLALMSQFKEDVYYTEEGQIFKATKYEILMDRNLVDRKKLRVEIARLQDIRDQFHKDKGPQASTWSDSEREFFLQLMSQINQVVAQEQSKTKEFVDLEGKHQAIMRDLKGTRDQRISKIESAKVSFLGLLKQLQEDDFRDKEGRTAELSRLAADKELDRLGSPHKYADGNEDIPILSADTLERLEQRHAEAKETDEATVPGRPEDRGAGVHETPADA